MSDDPAYFLYHSIGQYPGKAAEIAAELAAFSESWAALDDGQWPRALTARAEFLSLWAALIGAPAETLTTAETVTQALYSLIGALPDARLRGRRILVTADCFPSLHFLLAGMAERRGFTLDTVPLRPGAAWVPEEDMIAAWDESVALALLTFVTSTASFRADLAALTAHGRAMGSLTVADLTQGIGILPCQIGDTGADAHVSSSLKWLCGTPGAGILQASPALTAECAPELRGWFSQPNPFSWDLDAFAYAPDARRFDHGTPSVVAAVGALPGLRWNAAQPAGALLAHTRGLQAQIISEAAALGLPLVSPADPAQRGGSVMLRLPGTADPKAVVDALRQQRLHTDARGPILRLSPGIVTRPDHVDRLFAALKQIGVA